jgi:curved DNA-binding protein CbpA
MQERQTQSDADRQADEERQAKRKKSTKQLAREARQQAEERQISQSIREVYRKLASALHPDRETDPQERDRKTALMQRANQAYDKNNLLQLLELQLELEHIDQTAINNISEDRLKRYNKILKEQLAELEYETLHVEGEFRARFGVSPFAAMTPATLMRSLASDIVGIRQAIRDIEKDLLAFEDVKKLKLRLKSLRRRPAMLDLDDCPF